jgi:hypothetical protein
MHRKNFHHGDRHLYIEAGSQKHTQWLAPVSRAAELHHRIAADAVAVDNTR